MERVGTTLMFALGAAVAFFGTGQFLYRPKNSRTVLLAVATYSLAYVLFYYWAVGEGLLRRLPFLAYSDVSITFIIAPSLYLTSCRAIWEARWRRPAWPHFIAAAVAVPAVSAYAAAARPVDPGHFASPFIFAASLASDLLMFAYMVAICVQAARAAADGANRGSRRLRGFSWLFAGMVASSVLMLGAYVLRAEAVLAGASASFAVVVLGYSLACSRAAGRGGSAVWIGENVRREEADREAGDGEIARRLGRCMDEGRAYRDPDLDLKGLAAKCGVPEKDLSRYVNEVLGRNFRSYLNALRIGAVRAALAADPGRGVLEIAFEAGFNSKTAFNREFAREVGMSPSEYRKAALASGSPGPASLTASRST